LKAQSPEFKPQSHQTKEKKDTEVRAFNLRAMIYLGLFPKGHVNMDGGKKFTSLFSLICK
jgi:hypothetical protein